ncbi:metallophosphoesterase [bacterium]|nr:metallophosphoesterase [bacterium]
MRILSVSDVHAPLWLKDLEKVVHDIEEKPDILLIAGDMIDRGNAKFYRKVVDILSKLDGEMIAVFGNDEYDTVKDQILDENPEVIFLQDESTILEIDGTKIGIVGSKGSLEIPTSWQRKNIPGIDKIYKKRVSLIGDLLREISPKVDVRILLTHYATTTKTMRGENPRAWRYLGHRGFEKYMNEGLVDISIHGHVHNGRKMAQVGRTKVYNVAFPLWWGLVSIDVSREKQPSIEEFLSR